jgi:PilZ domain-containing protein
MSNNEQFPENGNSDMLSQAENIGSPTVNPAKTKPGQIRAARYPDMQSAVRFPIKLPISLKSKSGDRHTETENISSNGVLFEVDADMPLGSMVDFTISLPAEVVGAQSDVQIDCRGRVVRSAEDGGRRGVGVVIDEYRFDRR